MHCTRVAVSCTAAKRVRHSWLSLNSQQHRIVPRSRCLLCQPRPDSGWRLLSSGALVRLGGGFLLTSLSVEPAAHSVALASGCSPTRSSLHALRLLGPRLMWPHATPCSIDLLPFCLYLDSCCQHQWGRVLANFVTSCCPSATAVCVFGALPSLAWRPRSACACWRAGWPPAPAGVGCCGNVVGRSP